MDEGISVWGTSRNSKTLFQDKRFTQVYLDILKEKNLGSWFYQLDRRIGGFDLVINNAGFAALGNTTDISDEQTDAQLSVLLNGPIHLASAAVAAMRKRGKGCVVNVSSVASEMWSPYMSVYSAAKAGLSAFSQSLMLESPDNPPWIIDFRPGDYRTAFNQNIQRAAVSDVHVDHMWEKMEEAMRKAPCAAMAGKDLLSSLRKFRHCSRNSGTFVQTRVASLVSRLLSNALKRKVIRRYYQLP